MPYAETSKLKIAYEEAGSGPNVLVLVHGNFASSRWWKPVLERLPPGFRAITPVLRGCVGTTDTTPATSEASTKFEIPQLSDDLFDFVRCLGLSRFHLVGHSLGGAIAMQFALDHPDRLRSLMLVSSAPASGLAAMREGSSQSARMLRMWNPEDASHMGLLAMANRMHQAFGTNRIMLRSALAAMMPTAPSRGPVFDVLLDDAACMHPDAVVGFFRGLHRWNIERELARLGAPTLVLAGGKDVLIARAALEQTARLLPRGEFVEWPDVGHSPMLESPDAFARLIVEFSARQSLLMRIWTWIWLLWAAVIATKQRLVGPIPGKSRTDRA